MSWNEYDPDVDPYSLDYEQTFKKLDENYFDDDSYVPDDPNDGGTFAYTEDSGYYDNQGIWITSADNMLEEGDDEPTYENGSMFSDSFTTLNISEDGEQASSGDSIDLEAVMRGHNPPPHVVREEKIIVHFDRLKGPLGLKLIGNVKSPNPATFVQAVEASGMAAKCGQIASGDEIVEVNGQVVRGLTHFATSEEIKRAVQKGPLTMTLIRRSAQMSSSEAGDSSTYYNNSAPSFYFSDDTPLSSPNQSSSIIPGRETIVQLERDRRGALGISIVGGIDTLIGCVLIHEIFPATPAARDGRLWPGDQILEVSGTDLRQATHKKAIDALRSAPKVTSLLIFRDQSRFLQPTDGQDVVVVNLKRVSRNESLGFSIVGRKGGPGVFVSEVLKGSLADREGSLQVADQIMAINGRDVRLASQTTAVSLLKDCSADISLTLGRVQSKRASTSNAKLKPVSSRPSITPEPARYENTDKSVAEVTLLRGREGFGFSIVGGHDASHGDLPIIVKTVYQGGSAARDGRLKRGDQLLSVNGQNLMGLSHEKALNILRTAAGKVRLRILPA